MAQIENQQARTATIKRIRSEIAPLFFDPVPSVDTLRNWFDKEQIPRFKSNPTSKRGGGTCWYSVAAVEKYFRRLMAKAA